jgi:hypothetical protein
VLNGNKGRGDDKEVGSSYGLREWFRMRRMTVGLSKRDMPIYENFAAWTPKDVGFKNGLWR